MAWCGNISFDDLLTDDLTNQVQGWSGSGTNVQVNRKRDVGSYNRSSTSTQLNFRPTPTVNFHAQPQAQQNQPRMTVNQDSGSIADIEPGVPGKQISGVIIAKDDARSFPNKKEPGKDRHVIGFTIRDSPTDFINVTCWGEEEYIQTLSQQFHIGDVVDIQHYMSQSKPMDGRDEMFKPATPSNCQLTVSEKRSTIKHSCVETMSSLSRLVHCLVKANNDYYTIGDILTNGQQIHAQVINIMGVVRSVSPIKNVVSKQGKPLQHCEVRLLDETSSNFILNLWSDEMICLAQQWTPMDIILFAADVRVTYDEYRKTMVAAANRRSIITPNPDTREAHRLYQYAQGVDVNSLTDDSSTNGVSAGNTQIDLSTIEKVYTVNELKAMQQAVTGEGGIEYGIVFAHISKFDIDGDVPVTTTKCSKCRRRVDKSSGLCMNINCPQGSATLNGQSVGQLDVQTVYNINVQLTDHTGSLTPCSLTPDTAQTMLQASVDEFITLGEEEKTALKWKYLLERCKLYLKVNLPTYDKPQAYFNVLSCQHADLQEMVRFLH